MKTYCPKTAARLPLLLAACLVGFIDGNSVRAQVTLNDPNREIKIKLPEGAAAMALSDDGKLLAVHLGESVTPPELRLFDVVTGERLTSINGLAPSDVMFAFLPDGKHIAAAKDSKTAEEIKIWDVHSQELTKTISLPESATGRCSRLTFSPDGRWFAFLHSGGRGEEVIIREVSTGKVEAIFVCPFEFFFPEKIVFSPDSAYLACSGMNSVALWKLSNKKRIMAVQNARTSVGATGFSKDSSRFIVSATVGLLDDIKKGRASEPKCTLAYWNTSNGRETKRVNLPDLVPGGILTPDESSVIYFTADGAGKFQQRDTVQQLDLSTKKLIDTVPIGEIFDVRKSSPERLSGKAPKLFLSRNGETLALRYGDSIRLWRRAPAESKKLRE